MAANLDVGTGPHVPPSCHAGHSGGPHLTAGSGRAGSGVSAGAARWERHWWGSSQRRRDSWADRATLKIAEECEGPTGARSSRGCAGGDTRAAGPRRHRHGRCRRK